MDFDYHNAFQRLSRAYKDVEKEACEALMASGDVLVEQSKSLNQENDLKYFMSEYSGPFYLPNNTFQFTPFDGDDVSLVYRPLHRPSYTPPHRPPCRPPHRPPYRSPHRPPHTPPPHLTPHKPPRLSHRPPHTPLHRPPHTSQIT